MFLVIQFKGKQIKIGFGVAHPAARPARPKPARAPVAARRRLHQMLQNPIWN